MSEKKPFTLTDRAGTYVAGQRIKPGQRSVSLTEAEAEYELRERTIERQPAATPEPISEAASKASRKAVDKAPKGDEAV
jgi:hypothetical protein